MKVTMLFTRRGSEDGFAVSLFEAGKTYPVNDSLGGYFIRRGWAVRESEAV